MSDSLSPIQTEEKYVLPTYAKFPFLLIKGEGSRIFDQDGRSYLDLYGGHAVCVLGHSHPALTEAISKQASELIFYSNVCHHPARASAAEQIVTHSYPSMRQVYFCNSGAEANETALKIARKATGRSRVISMNDSFHGRTIGPLSVCGRDKLRSDFPDNLDHLTDFVPFGDMDAIRALKAEDTAAIILEPIQSMAGVFKATPEYYKELREYSTANGITLIFDEVQTAPGRTGKWFFGQAEDIQVEPDLVTSAKGIGGGFPVGVVIANEKISQTVVSGDHGSTFGGGPLAMACVDATFKTLESEGHLESVQSLSQKVEQELKSYQGGGLITDVRVEGYLIGVQVSIEAREITKRLREKGILAGSSYRPDTFRLLPPLTVSENEWEEFFKAFGEITQEI